MKDLIDKLDFVRTQILARYSVGPLNSEWAVSVVKHVLRTFVLHVSIARPLGEMGKLQLTNDMTELEFALSALMAVEDASASSAPLSGLQSARNKQSNRTSLRKPVAKLETIGDDYKALRGLRPLLFFDTQHLVSPSHTVGIPPLIVIHHIIVRSTGPVLTLPHLLQDWSEAEYVRWIDDHNEKERLALIGGCFPKWEAEVQRYESRNKSRATPNVGKDIDYVLLARTVLENARAQ